MIGKRSLIDMQNALRNIQESKTLIEEVVNKELNKDVFNIKEDIVFEQKDNTMSLDCTSYLKYLYGERVRKEIKSVTLNSNSKSIFLCIIEEKKASKFGIISEVKYLNLESIVVENEEWVNADEPDNVILSPVCPIKHLFYQDQSLEEIADKFLHDTSILENFTDILV